MAQVLKNKNLEIKIDLPLENYDFSRFDWTGKIASVKYKNTIISGHEILNGEDDTQSGKGFYNEFGFDDALGFAETKAGDWFHKIGIGLLKKDTEKYFPNRKYAIQPAAFFVSSQPDKIMITCKSPSLNGYAYVLTKEIRLVESGFIVNYQLKNTGKKNIHTDEYNHNFLAVNQAFISSDYRLNFPFYLKPEQFEETVNREGKVAIGEKEITFDGTPNEPFFFSNLSGYENIEAGWELINLENKIAISEKGSFTTAKVNVWGSKHVISPELFFTIRVEPGKEIEWSRTYRAFETG